MSVHEQFAEDLALYALGALTGEERTVLEAHLATCPGCKLELEQLRGDGALLALSTVGPRPPARARQRLLDAVAKEPRAGRSADIPRRSWWGVLGWAAAAAVVVFAASLWVDNQALHEQINAQRRQLSASQAELTSIRDVVTTLTATDAMHVTLVAAKTPPQPQGKAFYQRGRASLVFLANNLPALPPQKAYELWLIPAQGAPIPAGVFKPDARGSATVINPPLPAGTEAKAFAITIENEAGATSPTMPIVMMGTGE
jgi:anti-sigma-K factor RskA